MSCTHKFFGHLYHLGGERGLLPNWKVKTLFIGTFNPEDEFKEDNKALYYYGRGRNLFWKVLSAFAGISEIDNSDLNHQLVFLKKNEIGLTDLLVRINDANSDVAEHKKKLSTVLDSEIETFNSFEWNTTNVIEFLKTNGVENVYFTKQGSNRINSNTNTFESQIQLIENYCKENDIFSSRLHTPSGQGLGSGKPRINKLINKWYTLQGANRFNFISNNFNISDFNFSES